MAQEALNGLLQYLLATLSYDNRAWLSQHLIEPQDNISRTSKKLEPTEEQKARLREAYRQAKTGEVYSQEEAHRMMDEFAQEQYAVAV